MYEAFYRTDACKCRAVDGARITVGFGGVFVVRVMVGIWWSKRLRRSSGKVGGMYTSGFVVVHGACRLAKRSRPTEAGELAESVRWNFEGYGES